MTDVELLQAFLSNARVRAITTDYKFEGSLHPPFLKRDSSQLRCVVENDDRILHIFSAKNLEVIK